MSDLVQRLREETKWGNTYSGEILKLIETLERENNDMVIHFDRLVARNEKLEAALREIDANCDWTALGLMARRVARKALEELK